MRTVTFILILVQFVLTENAEETNKTLEEIEKFERLNGNFVSEKNIDLECEKAWRLPRNVVPTHYDITLRIDPQNPFFNGTVKIDIQCKQDTDIVTLHSKQLNLTMDKILVKRRSAGGSIISAKNITFDQDREVVYLKLNASLINGTSYVLKIRDFFGRIGEKEEGLFRKTYKENSKKRNVVGSQLEHTFARMVFPCFDEPNMKATFTVKIIRPAAYKSFSNMPLNTSTSMPQNRYLDKFQETIMLPTYTLAIVVGNYSTYPKNSSDFTHILASENDLKNMDLAYRVATSALRELKSYIKVPTPLSKVDHVSLPEFAPGGMENWGLIMYQNDYMVKEDNMLSLSTQEGFTFMAHELAHIWFGNMVTVDWWSYVWLNEGFSTFLQFYITDKIFPEWRLLDQFLISQFQVALKADAEQKNPKPALSSPVCTSKEIDGLFDEISYCKGASILRMFIAILGKEEVFQDAMKLYLESRWMKTVRPADWFQVLDDVIRAINETILPENATFGEVGASWSEQAGFPVLTVTRNYTSSTKDSYVSVEQERFLDQRSKIDLNENHVNRWWIPLTWTTASQILSKDWLYEDKSILVRAQRSEWLLFNINVTGYYRVNYDDQNWHLLSQALQKSRNIIPSVNRAQLLDDAFSMAFAHRLNMATALNLTRFLKDEDDVVVWMSACKQFQLVYELVGSTTAYPKLQKYMQKLLRKTYRRVRLDVKEDEPHLDKILRFTVAPLACLFGLDSCLSDSESALSHFLVDTALEDEQSPELHPDIESTVLCGGVQSGGKDIFDQLRSLAFDEHVPGTDHTTAYLSALSCTSDDDRLVWHLNDIFDNNTHFDGNEASQAIKNVIETPHTLPLVIQYLQTNVNKINQYFESSQNTTEDLVMAIIQHLRTNEQYNEMHEWIDSTRDNELGNKKTLLEHLESRKSEVDWSNESVQQISDWLKTLSAPAAFSKENVTIVG